MRRSKGFTLIELLAVIVILGVIMLIAIPSVTGYITSSRKNSFASTGANIIDAVRKYAITANGLPNYTGDKVVYRVVDETGNIAVKLDSGGTKSAFGAAWIKGYNYVVIEATDNNNYNYYYAGYDASGNYIPLTLEDKLKGGVVKNTSELADGKDIDDEIFKLPESDDDTSVWTGGVDFVDDFDISIAQDGSDPVRLYRLYPNNGDVLL